MLQEVDIEKTVFRAYDIRGIIQASFQENAFYTLGRAISKVLLSLGKRQVYLGRDGRLSSPSLSHALSHGFLKSGINVLDLGSIPTPLMYYATQTTSENSGVMVTGSHNPAPYNGIKMVLAGKTLLQSDIDTLYEYVHQKNFVEGEAKHILHDIFPSYMHRILTTIRIARPLKVIVDCGNGIAGSIVPQVLQKLGIEVLPLYCEVDGRFPHHHPDPSVEENLIDLIHKVQEEGADLGLAFDGDGDRLGVVTNQGKVIWPDRLLMYYAKHLLSYCPKATIVFDVKCSAQVAAFIKAHGGIPYMCPTGHSIVKSVMKAKEAAFAGEMSGHLFFQQGWYGFDDALYSACRLLEMLSQSSDSPHQQFLEIPDSINTPELKISIAEQEKFAFMYAFQEKATFPGAKLITIDGIRAEFPYGFGLLRASNTTPNLIARFEALDMAGLQCIQKQFRQAIMQINPSLSLPF